MSYVDDLARLAYGQRRHLMSWTNIATEDRNAYRDEARAVAAKVLADALTWFITHPVESGLKDIVGAEPVDAAQRLIESFRQFAADHGIDLEPQP